MWCCLVCFVVFLSVGVFLCALGVKGMCLCVFACGLLCDVVWFVCCVFLCVLVCVVFRCVCFVCDRLGAVSRIAERF